MLITVFFVGFLNAQNGDFDKFIACFPNTHLPYIKNNFTKDTTRIIPNNLALKYLCANDSSLLEFEVVGMNQETLEVKYRIVKPFEYRAFAKVQIGNTYLLLYDGFTEDGYHDFTTVLKLGLFNTQGQLLDEMLFYVFDDSGKLEEQTGQITTDFKVNIFHKKYIEDEKDICTPSYYKMTTTYEIDSAISKFKEVCTNKEFIDNSKK